MRDCRLPKRDSHEGNESDRSHNRKKSAGIVTPANRSPKPISSLCVRRSFSPSPCRGAHASCPRLVLFSQDDSGGTPESTRETRLLPKVVLSH
jgi:hypothetical protein